MKLRILLFVVAALALVSVGLFFPETETIVSEYQSRESQMTTADYNGALEIYKKLRGNIETGEVQPSDWHEMRQAVAEHNRATRGQRQQDLTWIEMGPNNIGGRTRAVLAVDDNTIFAGSVSGGLWKSTDGANTWNKVTGLPHCVIGSIAQSGNGDIYVGSGSSFEGNAGGEGGSDFPGGGLFRSSDDGETWEIIPGTEPPAFSTSSAWNTVNALATDDSTPNRVYIAGGAGFGYYDSSDEELDMDYSEGLSNVFTGFDIQIGSDGTFLLSTNGAVVYKSVDGGENFTQIEMNNGGTGGELPQGNDRAVLAISPDDPDYCYVAYADNSQFGGVWASENGGDTWNNVWLPSSEDPTHNPSPNPQCFYDLAISVTPGNPEVAIVGAVQLWKTGLGSQPEQIAWQGGFQGFEYYVHSDIHYFEWAPNGDLLIGTDGGIFKSTDGAVTFYPANLGYNVTQFYGIAHSAGNAVMGGAQDNGTTVIWADDTQDFVQEGIEIMGGDGYDCEFSQVTDAEGAAFATSQYGVTMRFTPNGGGGGFLDDELMAIYEDNGFEPGSFYSTIKLFEDTEDEDSQHYIELVNPNEFDIVGSDENPITFDLLTENLNIPFTFTLPEGQTLHYYDTLIRPEVTLDEVLGEMDPDYFWLPAQELNEIIYDNCVTDSTFVDSTLSYIITPIDTCITFQDSVFCVTIGYDSTEVYTDNYDYNTTCDTLYHYNADMFVGEPEHILVQDQYTSLFCLPLLGNNGIWLTRGALDFNDTPDWFRIANGPGGAVKAMAFSEDGDHLFYSSWNGQLYRVSNLDQLYSDEDVELLDQGAPILSTGSAITGIAIDPNDPNHMVVTVGGYGNVSSGKVQETFNALDGSPDFENIWYSSGDPLANMPIYDAIIDVSDTSGETIVIGTDFGIFTTDNGGDDWSQQNDPADASQSSGIDACPTFTVRQQTIGHKRFMHPINTGTIYAGTHGRGIFRSEDLAFTGIDNPEGNLNSDAQDMLLVYPNPSSNVAYMDVTLSSASDVIINIYSINGDLVKTIKQTVAAGEHTLQLDIADLSQGNYVIHMDAGSTSGVAKFIIME